MKLVRTKIWNWWDISILKWCCFLFGMIAGAYLKDFVFQNVWIIFFLAIALTVRTAIVYWRD